MFKIGLQIILLFIVVQLGCLSNCTFAQGKQLKFEHLSVKQGLSQSTVFAIAQDSKGFMWFGTRTGGLNKFDGNSFKVYKNDPEDPYSISGNEILSIFEDSKGRMWVGTRNFGVNRFDYNTERFYQYLNAEVSNDFRDLRVVNSIVEDYKGRIWVSTLGGLCLYDEASDSFIIYDNKENNIVKGSAAMSLAQDSILCFGNKEGLYFFNTNTKKVFRHLQYEDNNPNSLSSNVIISMYYDKNGVLWVGTRKNGVNRLMALSDSDFTRIQYDPFNNSSISSDVVRVISEDKNGAIWICTSDGLNQLLSSEVYSATPQFIRHKKNLGIEKSLAQDVLFSFYEDFWGNIWIGTWSSGVDYLNVHSKEFNHFNYNKDKTIGLRNNNVSSFAENKYGIWVGTDGGGVSLFDRKDKKFLKHITTENRPRVLKSDNIRTLYADNDNSLWIGAFEGLSHYNCETGSAEMYLEDYIINYITPGIDDELWLGTAKCLIKFNKKTRTHIKYYSDNFDSTTIADNNINVLFTDNNKDIWFGTKKGLNVYNRAQDNFIRYQYSALNSKSLSNDNVVAINSDEKGNLWIGTYDGLNLFNPKDQSFTHYNEKDGLPDNVVNGILSDNKGNIWLSTNKGLAKFYITRNGDEETIVVRNYTEYDGLQSDEFGRHSYFKAKNGELLFGGINGFNIFDPEKIKDNTDIPKVVITGLKLFNKVVHVNDENDILSTNIALSKEISLNYKQSVFTFSFAALSYASPEQNQFAYMMEGFDKDWNYIGNKNEAFYTSLPAGEYVFRVKACNNDGVWNEEGTSLKVNILPPWWKALWFRILSVLFVALVVGFGFRQRTQVMRRKQKELESKVKIATDDVKQRNEKLEEAKLKLAGIMDDVKGQLGLASDQLLEATNSQAASIEEISTSIEQMANDIDENAIGASKMFENAQIIEKESELSVGIVGQTVSSIEDIAEEISSISGFAQMTNILSINAAIEAARAGEQGKSFGVVASQVKELADQSHKVAITIKNLSESGLSLSNSASSKIIELQAYIKSIVALISQISQSSKNQSISANHISTAIQEVSTYVNSTTSLAEKLDSAIKSLSVEEH
jgi:ligand-binding sensor domain-containing protein/methyl-accepting chemotaxis protein